MKKKQTNTLGSWIDQSEMQRLSKALLPDDQEQQSALESSVSDFSLPKRDLDIDQASAYKAAAFPRPSLAGNRRDEPARKTEPAAASDRNEADEIDEGPVLRAAKALAEVRLRAEENGFLKKRGVIPAGLDPRPTTVPPVLGSAFAKSANLAADSLASKIETGVESFQLVEGPLRERLDAFAGWAMSLVGASRIVIVDGQGYSLLHRDLDETAGADGTALADSAMRLTSVLEQVQARTDFARDGALNLPLEEGGWLGVLRCESAGGRLCIALVTSGPLELEKSSEMKRAMVRTMESGSH